MYKEVFYEEGIVKEVKKEIAVITLPDSEDCKECTIKLYCKPGNSKERSLVVRDSYGVNPGDAVRVSINGSKLLSASFKLYGVPLLLLVIGTLAGMMIFETNKELYSALAAIGLITIYGLFLSVLSRDENPSNYPEIVFVSSRTSEVKNN
ncbi:MAG: SoxR reducing system RseC family protein [Ignavibacteriaceae bacterium]